MADSKRIRVMISSRVNKDEDKVEFDGKPVKLTVVRQELKKELEEIELLGNPLFEVWINELAPAAEGSIDSWEKCMDEVRRAHIVIALYNGNAGWAKEGGDIGICHAEMDTALSAAPAKLRIVEINPLAELGKGADAKRNKAFQEYYSTKTRFRSVAKNGNEIIERSKAAVRDAVLNLSELGIRDASKGEYYSGAALDWSRMGFHERAEAMRDTLTRYLKGRGGAAADKHGVVVNCDRKPVLFVVHAIPAAMSVASARELVGQPFLKDHDLLEDDSDWAGPVHLIACHKTVTENQAIRLLGFPDATVVSPPFGVYVADDVQKIQLLLLKNCRDETSTGIAALRAFEWLSQNAEEKRLAARAVARKKILKVIAKEANA